MKIGNYKVVNIDDLKPYSRNSRTHSAVQIEQIKKSILEFGFTNPLLINENNEIIAGHGRLEALRQLNKIDFKECPVVEIPCIEILGLNEAQYKALVIADNKIAENAGWNTDLLKEEIEALQLLNYDIELLAFSDEELIEIGLDDKKDSSSDCEDKYDVICENFEAKVIQFGDLIEFGGHRILCGDSTKKADIERLMNGMKADMVLSDPPYGMNLDTNFGTICNDKANFNIPYSKKYHSIKGDNDDFTPELITTFFENFNYCKEMFLFGADYYCDLLLNKDKGTFLVWDKRKGIEDVEFSLSEFEIFWSRKKHLKQIFRHLWFGAFGLGNSTIEDLKKRIHANQKPIALFMAILEKYGKDKNIIVDLYLGSGSVLIACEKMNKKCFGIEYKKEYVENIISRYVKLTNDKNITINGQKMVWDLELN